MEQPEVSVEVASPEPEISKCRNLQAWNHFTVVYSILCNITEHCKK